MPAIVGGPVTLRSKCCGEKGWAKAGVHFLGLYNRSLCNAYICVDCGAEVTRHNTKGETPPENWQPE